MTDLEIAVSAVEEAQSRGAAASEAYLLNSDSIDIEVAQGQVETLKLAKDTGIGLRIISQAGAVGFAYSTCTEKGEISRLVSQALDNSRKSFIDPYHALPIGVWAMPYTDLLDAGLRDATVEEKISLACEMEDAAKAADKRITQSERCMYQDTIYGVALANSNGFAASYRAGFCGLYGAVIAAHDGDVQSGMAVSYRRNIADLSPAHVGREAAAQALMLLGGRSIRTMKATLVLSPYVATNFLSVLAAAFSADAVQKGKSMLQDRLGQQVASSAVTVIDDGTLLNGIATAPFDGEGVLSARKELISGGKLLGFLHNSLTAARCGTVSTGNGVRNSFKSVTEVGPTNLFICAGDTAPQDIIRAVDNGFYVTAVMGLHMANPISGDFSLGAAGVWIENGELTHAVRGVAIAGNMLDLLGKVKAVGSDLTFFGSKGAPTLRIEEIMISGE